MKKFIFLIFVIFIILLQFVHKVNKPFFIITQNDRPTAIAPSEPAPGGAPAPTPAPETAPTNGKCQKQLQGHQLQEQLQLMEKLQLQKLLHQPIIQMMLNLKMVSSLILIFAFGLGFYLMCKNKNRSKNSKL